jgi:glycosyltransferase involved in cell wall biosynthesis
VAVKITLGIIARNAGATLQRCLESAAPYVDEIIIGLAGESTDDTIDIAANVLGTWSDETGRSDNEAGLPFEIFDIEWKDDFSAARNEVLKRATGDYFLWLDADDELVGGENLRRWVERNPDANCFWAAYVYDRDEHNNVSTTLWRERLVRNPADWHWEGAVHEFLMLAPEVPLAMAQMDDVVVIHQEGRQKSKGNRNLDILYKELAKSEPEPSQRLLFYLFRENAARGNLHEALLHANRYISRAQFGDEAYQMAYGIADTLRVQKRFAEASKAALKAIEIDATWPDAYFLMARMAYEQGRFVEAIEWTRNGATKVPPKTSVIIDPRTYSYWPYYFLALAYRALGDWPMAIENFKIAAAVVPDNQIMGFIDEAARAQESQAVLDSFMGLYEHLGRHDEWLKARRLFALVPKELEQHPVVREAHLRTLDSTAHVDDPQIMVDFYRNNPGWAPMDEDLVWSAGWAAHPRMAFARKSVTCDPPATILDLGSSDGFISLPLAQEGHIVEGYDLDPRCVDLANERAVAHKLRAHYNVGSIEDVEGKYDVAFAFEILEHLVDPAAFLDAIDQKARKVVITTPFLAWEGGRVADWQKVEPKGHLRVFDLLDMEGLLSGRGRIFDLYREPYGRAAWIFASYRPRQRYAGTVAFLAPSTIEEWSPRKLAAEGLGGSETALIRLAEELFYAGGNDTISQMCTVYGRVDNPGFYNGVRYRMVGDFNPAIGYDVLVAWRYPEAADLPTRAGKLVLWMHDTDAGDRLTPVRAARFDAIVVLSEWHKAHMLKTYPWLDAEKLVIIGNGVDVARFETRPAGRGSTGGRPRNSSRGSAISPEGPVRFASPRGGGPTRVAREPHRVAYTSSPDRGLDVVLEHVWPKVVEQVPDAELHVYYGMGNIDTLAPNYPYLAEFRQRLANLLLGSVNVVQHGRVAPDVLAADLQKASVWLYPSHNFDETYCISAVEAQLAGAIPVTSNRGALAETVGSGLVIDGTIGIDDGVAEQYAQAVVQLLTGDEKELTALRRKVRRNAPAQGWTEVAAQWLMKIMSPTET